MRANVSLRLGAVVVGVLTLSIGSGLSVAAPSEAPPGEPSAPGEPSVPGEPSAPSEPSAPGEPGPESAEPEAAAAAQEPAAGDEPAEPQPPTPPAETVTEAPKIEAAAQYGAGVGLRGVFVPTWLMNLFLDASTPLNSVAFSGEFVRRKGNFDIIGSIEFGFYSPRDGNYLGKGDDPATQTDFIHFDGLSHLAFAVHFIRHENILDWLSFVWGGGVGLAVVLGKMFRASSGSDDKPCTENNLDDLSACHPNFPDYSPDSDAWLNNGDNQGSESEDSPGSPKIFKEEDVPPVLPLIHLLVGFNFKITDLFSVRVDGGFRNSFYVGAAGHYFF